MKKENTARKTKTSKITKEEKKEKVNKEVKEKVKEQEEQKQEKTNNKLYFSFTHRLIFEIIIFLTLLTLGTLLLNKSLKYENTEIIEYNEESNLDYKVYLFENNFYEEKYLEKDMLYVASLIDKVHIDFDYKFNIADLETLDFNYKIVGKLSITNKEETKSYYEKTYILSDNKKVSMNNQKEQTIKDSIDIDYPYYNSLANNFKNSYGLDTESNLKVFMIIDKQSTNDSNFEMNNNSIMNVKIPLSEKSINIELDYNDINKTSTVLKQKELSISNIILLVLSIVFIILSIIMVIRIIRKLLLLVVKKSAYDKYIEKLLKEYDRLIAEVSTMTQLEGKEVIRVNKFTELLDIHDNLQLPIMYYSVNDHQKANFYISHDKTVYLLTIKSIDNKNYRIEN